MPKLARLILRPPNPDRIVIARGTHQLSERSAFRAAGAIAEGLRKMGKTVVLRTVPYETTLHGLADAGIEEPFKSGKPVAITGDDTIFHITRTFPGYHVFDIHNTDFQPSDEPGAIALPSCIGNVSSPLTHGKTFNDDAMPPAQHVAIFRQCEIPVYVEGNDLVVDYYNKMSIEFLSNRSSSDERLRKLLEFARAHAFYADSFILFRYFTSLLDDFAGITMDQAVEKAIDLIINHIGLAVEEATEKIRRILESQEVFRLPFVLEDGTRFEGAELATEE